MFDARTLTVLVLAASLTESACSGGDRGQDRSPRANESPAEQNTAAKETLPDQDDAPAPSADSPAAPSDARDPVGAAVAHPDRSADDKARDAHRKPGEVLRFFGIEPGMKVADLMTGTGYYAEILGRVVGPAGAVYAQNNQFVVDRFNVSPILEARIDQPGMQHVKHVISELDALDLPNGELDAVLLVLFYHDTYWMDVDRARMNQAIFDALKPGGVYGIIDHHAEAGSGDRDVESLHRGDAEMIKKELLAAGFEFDGHSDALRHPEDDRTTSVFDESLRGKTDRFVFRFRKPAE